MIDPETIEQWLDNLIKDAKAQGASDYVLAYILLQHGLNHYISSFTKCELCSAKHSK